MPEISHLPTTFADSYASSVAPDDSTHRTPFGSGEIVSVWNGKDVFYVDVKTDAKYYDVMSVGLSKPVSKPKVATSSKVTKDSNDSRRSKTAKRSKPIPTPMPTEVSICFRETKNGRGSRWKRTPSISFNAGKIPVYFGTGASCKKKFLLASALTGSIYVGPSKCFVTDPSTEGSSVSPSEDLPTTQFTYEPAGPKNRNVKFSLSECQKGFSEWDGP